MHSDDMQVDAAPNVVRVPIPALPSVPPPPDLYDKHRGTNIPIVIDNGSTTFRWGFADSEAPRFGPNAISKYKERKTNRPLLLFGEAIDVESGAKAQTRTAWEGDILLNFDALENALDYAFVNLGLDTPTVEHPVLMTERLSTPLHSRALTSELMFEQYSVPALSYCIDGLMSFYGNNKKPGTDNFEEDGLCISFNTASTAVMPILNGKGILSHAKRIPWGSLQSSEYLLKLIQLKYPNFPTRVTTTQSNWMLRNFCDVSTNYSMLLKSLKDPLKLRASETIIQFPFALQVAEEKTEEELARIAEKRKEQGRKLQELAAKTRMEKLLQKENDLQHLLELRESRGEDGKREWNNKLSAEGFDDDSQLDDTIKKLESGLKKARKKEAADGGDDPIEEPSFPLVDVPDVDLDEDGLKEKKKQKLIKAGYEARARARREKEREKEEKEREEKREEEEREADLGGWSRKLRQEQEVLMDRIKNRSRRKAALSDRKSAAAQARMKSIANLAADDRISKKKRKGAGEDMFGADDADWAIYRKINTTAASSDEEEDLIQLQLIEQKLLAHDPTFTAQHTHASITAQRSALLTAFKPVYEEGDVEGNTRIHLNTEKWRVCEAWFSPGIAGVDSAGVGEVIQNILSRFSDAEKARLVKNIFLTGSPSQFSGMIPRLHNTLRPLLPQDMPVNIVRAADPSLDAWKGMSLFSVTSEFEKTCFTKAEYEEYGPEKIRKWWGSNWNSSYL
ncbi:actin-like protein Arp5p [Guyanagaster necrorhizus]|uniref:Actin-like protein Arp5p n=1 Tax=Guyanagaster necrorhizus TaxID=856835 RepID=A0A9P7W1P4_9AGAR|nr:actin-like protein Arp5p [Guyanagaster necrorhizus MCA 3950]KAG7451093.1 actin-like protein Arp5p [Guyanagaster necrorhizus MCA 3950]